MTQKQINDQLREMYVNNLIEALTAAGEEVLRVGNNVIAIPVVDAGGEDNYVEFTVKIPVGSRDGDAYDGYSLAQDYQMKCEAKAEKAAKAAEEKAKKIARDEAMRRQKAEAKAKREGK